MAMSNFKKQLEEQKKKGVSVREQLDKVESNGILDDYIQKKDEKVNNKANISVVEESNIPFNLKPQNMPETTITNKTNSTEDENPDVLENEKIKDAVRVFPKEKLAVSLKSTEAWGFRLSPDAVDDFDYAVYKENTTSTEFINRIFYAEKEFEESHLEIFTDEYVRNNLRRKDKNKDKVRKGFSLLSDVKEFIDIAARRNGMSKTDFVEFVINQYCKDI